MENRILEVIPKLVGGSSQEEETYKIAALNIRGAP